MKKIILFTAIALSAFSANAAEPVQNTEATNNPEPAKGDYVLTIKNHKFSPDVLTIPANEKVRILIDNQDATPEEFESSDLRREKIVKGNSKGYVLVGPLTVGEYKYFGEFNQDTAKGSILAK